MRPSAGAGVRPSSLRRVLFGVSTKGSARDWSLANTSVSTWRVWVGSLIEPISLGKLGKLSKLSSAFRHVSRASIWRLRPASPVSSSWPTHGDWRCCAHIQRGRAVLTAVGVVRVRHQPDHRCDRVRGSPSGGGGSPGRGGLRSACRHFRPASRPRRNAVRRVHRGATGRTGLAEADLAHAAVADPSQQREAAQLGRIVRAQRRCGHSGPHLEGLPKAGRWPRAYGQRYRRYPTPGPVRGRPPMPGRMQPAGDRATLLLRLRSCPSEPIGTG